MPNPKTGSNRWVPDIRPDKVETATETNEKQSEQYRIVDAHPILGGILDKLAYFRTHAGAVWYNKLAGITVLQKLDNLASNIGVLAQLATTDKTSLVAAINTLSSQVDSLNSHHIPKNLGTSPLNDIKITGVYYQTTNINAVLERNYPIKQAGLLLVYYCTDDWVYQIYVPYTDTTIFKRVFYIFNPGWYPWVKFDGMNI